MADAIVYWKGLEELRADVRRLDAQRRQEFVEPLPWKTEAPPPAASASTSRRDFLTLMGFTVTAAACSRAPVEKALPFVRQPEEIVPGVANWYATTCGGCSAGCGLLVKTRDGRPIKIEGNPDSPVFGGGTCAVGQATVLSLYDQERVRQPLWHGQPVSWSEMDAHVLERLKNITATGGRMVLVSGPVLGPSTRDLIARWVATYPSFQHVVYEPASLSAIRRAHEACFGRAAVPHYRFDEAALIVGLDADFLGTWISPVEFTRQYTQRRAPGRDMARHIQFESGLSLTGANADLRHIVAPSDMGRVVLALLNRVRASAGAGPTAEEVGLPVAAAVLDDVAGQLWKYRGKSLVVCGAQDVAVQTLVAALNDQLGNIGRTIDLAHPSLQSQADDREMVTVVEDMQRGAIQVLMLYGVNPAYDYSDGAGFIDALDRVALSVSFSDRLDESAARVRAVCPDHHFLEAWGDAEPIAGYYSLVQPTLHPLFQTRAAQDSLLAWLEAPVGFHAFVREHWKTHLFPRVDSHAALHTASHTGSHTGGEPGAKDDAAETAFDRFWDRTLQAGFADLRSVIAPAPALVFAGDVAAASARVIADDRQASAVRASDQYELHLFESVALRDGRHANNPWLQELPDPITKLTWGHCLAVAPSVAKQWHLEDGDVVSVSAGALRVDVPAFIQPGQSPKTVSIALGYGRTHGVRIATDSGANVYPLMRLADDGARRRSGMRVTLEKTGRHEALAATQTHHTMNGRPLVREATLAEFLGDPAAGNEPEPHHPTLWPGHEAGAQTWGMAIDLGSCTGCSACIVACTAENNVPVVGRDEVRRGREMHWIRIDRYHRGPEDHPETVFQPVMCQHCANAPCETVCPVLATVHSADGINQQVYNRCIGTRYCENNCPYKVRRFNWFTYAHNPRFDYTMNHPVEAMVLNPDVVVRSRGVMEKCSLCVQRIQAGKLAATLAGRPLADGDIRTACQQACPSQAIVFGNLQDPESAVSRLAASERHYHLLAGVGTRPNVGYLTKIRNREEV